MTAHQRAHQTLQQSIKTRCRRTAVPGDVAVVPETSRRKERLTHIDSEIHKPGISIQLEVQVECGPSFREPRGAYPCRLPRSMYQCQSETICLYPDHQLIDHWQVGIYQLLFSHVNLIKCIVPLFQPSMLKTFNLKFTAGILSSLRIAADHARAHFQCNVCRGSQT